MIMYEAHFLQVISTRFNPMLADVIRFPTVQIKSLYVCAREGFFLSCILLHVSKLAHLVASVG